jgi:hypothetical protein
MAELQLNLTTDEREYLLGVMDVALKEACVQEHRTRTPLYREHVLHQEELIRGLLDKLRKNAGPEAPLSEMRP